MDKIFTPDELAKIKRIIEHIFSLIGGNATLQECLCRMEVSENGVFVQHHLYEVTFTSTKGDTKFLMGYPNLPNIPIVNYAWLMLAQIYYSLMSSLGNTRDQLEEILWPTGNNYDPDYHGLDLI